MRSALLAAALLASLSLPFQAAQAVEPGSGASPAYMQIMDSMNKKMEAMKSTGDPNKDFAMMMSMHHQSAIDMAQAYISQGNDPTLKTMAEKIISDQKREIGEFEKWQSQHSK